MVFFVHSISVLLFVLLLSFEAESQGPTITAKPNAIIEVLEGGNVTLEWTYDLRGAQFLFAKLVFADNSAAKVADKVLSGGTINVNDSLLSGRVVADITDTFTSIRFLQLNRTDGRKYLFEVNNVNLIVASSEVDLQVQFPPSLTVRAIDQVLVEGDPATFTLNCSADGVPPPNIIWTKVFGNGSDSDVLLNETTPSQLVLNNNRSNEGTYRCTADNGIGSAVNHTVSVTVNFKPEDVQLTVNSNNANICRNETVNFTCSAFGKPPVHAYQLFVNESLVDGNSSAGFWNQTLSTEGVFFYTCVANNTLGTNNTTRTVTVNVPSAIWSLSNITVVEGENRSLVCAVSGLPTPSVSWTEVRTANRSQGSIRQLTNISRNDAGKYTCEASNVCGNDTKSIFLTVHFPPSLTVRAIDLVLVEGDPATFMLSCAADGVPTPNVVWTKVFENRSDSDVLLNATTPSQLVLNNNRSNEGTYRCTADNGIGNAVNHTVSVTVNFPPENVHLSASETTVCRGAVITFNCSANANPMVHTYQLYENDVLVNESNSTGVWNTTLSNGGVRYFTCVANNTVGTTNSTPVSVNVNVESEILALDNITVVEGENRNLSCAVTGRPVPSVSWTEVRTGNQSQGTVRELNNIRRNDEGEYTCVSSNECGNDTKSLFLTVHFRPENVQLSVSETTVCRSSMIMVNCSADGNPMVHTYQLYENDTVVNESSSSGIWNRTLSTGGVFIYRCVANNTVGTASSMDVSVTVNEPSFIQVIQNQTLTEGESLTLTCRASGMPLPSVSWVNVSSGQHTSGSTLVLTNITRNEAGQYRCEASNPCGNESESVTVDVQYPPGNVQLLASEETTCLGSTVKLTCSADAKPMVHTYQLYRNSTMVGESSNSGVWNKTMSEGGVSVYACMVNNTLGTANSSTVSVTVNVPSTIQPIQDEVNVVTEGHYVTIFCNATGIPQPSVSWIKVGGNQRFNANPLEFRNINRNEAGTYRCEATNPCTSASKNASIDVQFPAYIVPLEDKLIFNKSDTVTLFCNVSGKPQPTVMWTHVSTNRQHNNATWVISDLSVSELGVYRCDANNSYGNHNDSVTIEFPGGKCEAKCLGRKTCRIFGKYICRCEDGKKGDNCEETETLKKTVFVGLKIDQEFKEEYKDLDNPETKRFVARVEGAMQDVMAGTGVTNVRVTELRQGSVIADVELTFNRSVSQDSVDTLLTQVTADGKLGAIDVSEVRVGGSIGATEEPAKECSALFEGPDCKKAKPALIIICVIAGVIVLALLVAIVACSMHKKKSSGGSSLQNGSYAQRQDPEGNGTMDKGFDGTGGRIPRANYVNNAYDPEQEPAHQMVTFNSNPAQTPGITLNDSSQTQQT